MDPDPMAKRKPPKPRACRRLFADEGDVEEGLRDNMMNQISEQINHRLEEINKKYNFDFRNEVPLEGDWVWERLKPKQEGFQTEANTAASVEAEEAAPEGPTDAAPQPPPTPGPQTPPSVEPSVPQ